MDKNQSTQIETLSTKLSEIVEELKQLEEKSKNLNKVKYAVEQELAESLDEAGFTVGSKIELKNGKTVTLKEYFKASIPSQTTINKEKDFNKRQSLIDKKEKCLKWLQENQLDDIIKNNIVASLPKDSNEIANELSALLEEKGISFTRDESVHPSTLKSTLDLELKKGNIPPLDDFSVQHGSTVAIK
jgi:hypothetical protein